MRIALGALAALAALLATSCKDCNDSAKGGAGGGQDSGAADAMASADPSGAAIQAVPGCHPTIPGGHALKLGTPASLSLAATRGKALLVSTAVDRALSRATGITESRARSERVVLGATGAADAPPEAIAAGMAGDVSTHAAAVNLAGELTTLTYATPAPAGRTPPPACADGVLAAVGSAAGTTRRELATRVCRPATTFRAAARGKLGIALATVPGPTAVEAWLLDGADTKPFVVENVAKIVAGVAPSARAGDGGATGPATIDAPVVAAGATSVGAAYVVDRGGSARELHVSRVGRGGELRASVEVLDKQHVGTVSVAFENDTLHVVWSSFVPEKSRWVLRWSKWPAGGAPSAPQSIGTGVVSATLPSLAVDGARFLLAWAEGDEHATVVRVGASTKSLAAISGLSDIVSKPGLLARDPVVALEGDAMFVAWTERARPDTAALARDAHDTREPAVVRASALRCLE
jgi:hypothetical protein